MFSVNAQKAVAVPGSRQMDQTPDVVEDKL
jgi:hypothetical protein